MKKTAKGQVMDGSMLERDTSQSPEELARYGARSLHIPMVTLTYLKTTAGTRMVNPRHGVTPQIRTNAGISVTFQIVVS